MGEACEHAGYPANECPLQCKSVPSGPDKSPGPVYSLPTLVGQGGHDKRSTHPIYPAYSIKGTPKELTPYKKPGPAEYGVNTKLNKDGLPWSPKYSITGIQKDLKSFKKPGPAEYEIRPGYKQVYKTLPAYTMRPNNPYAPKRFGPGPDTYNLPKPDTKSTISTLPKYTMRPKYKDDRNPQKPGPSDYSLRHLENTKMAAPKYTMTGATQDYKPRYPRPGPATYYPNKLKKDNFKYSMGIKHSGKKGILVCNRYDDC